MKLIDANELRAELRCIYNPYSDELYRIEKAIDKMREYELPLKLRAETNTHNRNIHERDFLEGVIEGWNKCLESIVDNSANLREENLQ